MPCYNCGRSAIFQFGEGDQQLSLCLDCGIKYQNMLNQQIEQNRRAMNFSMAEFENIAGLPQGHFPRYETQKPSPIVNMGATVLNNININHSQVGVVNTGTIESVDASISVLMNSGEKAFANAVKEFSEAVANDENLESATKNEILEIVSALSSEAVAPPEARRKSVVRALRDQISNSVKAVGPYASLVGNLISAVNLFFQLQG